MSFDPRRNRRVKLNELAPFMHVDGYRLLHDCHYRTEAVYYAANHGDKWLSANVLRFADGSVCKLRGLNAAP